MLTSLACCLALILASVSYSGVATPRTAMSAGSATASVFYAGCVVQPPFSALRSKHRSFLIVRPQLPPYIGQNTPELGRLIRSAKQHLIVGRLDNEQLGFGDQFLDASEKRESRRRELIFT
jgi:hypothetical protein